MTSALLELSGNNSYGNVMNNSGIYENVTCLLDARGGCMIDHDLVCVGDPLYCNLTRDEYMELLHDYISPTLPEWILIFSHCLVFFMGLVSYSDFETKLAGDAMTILWFVWNFQYFDEETLNMQ